MKRNIKMLKWVVNRGKSELFMNVDFRNCSFLAAPWLAL